MLRCFINSTSEESWAKGVGGCVGERGEEDEEKSRGLGFLVILKLIKEWLND
jgi:hypothetical protein